MITGRYEYRDQLGKLLYWKDRIEPGRNGAKKEFRFYHGDKHSGRGGESILYRLPQVIKSKAVIITEGEKQADLITSWGLCATSLDSGAGSKIPSAMIEILTGKRIAMLCDNDDPGRAYAQKIGIALNGKCESYRIVELPDLPDKGDVIDWNGDKQQLIAIIKNTPEWVAPPEKKRKVTERKIAPSGDITPEMIEAACQYPIDKLIEVIGNKLHCFNHKEKTPSMIFYPTTNHVKCYGCGYRGSAIDVIRWRDGINFVEAVRALQC